MTKHDFATMRQAMVVSQLRPNAVSEPRVVAAIEAVPREAFVAEERRALAYVDVAVPLGNGRSLAPPMATARLITEAGISDHDHVLLVGCATGYAAAVLAGLAQSVVALECDAVLAKAAKANLAGLANVELVTGDLAKGHAKGAPYDAIVIDGAVEQVPEALVKQLKEGGRLAAAILDKGVSSLAAGVKAGGAVRLRAFAEADAPPLPGFSLPRAFRF